MFYIQIILFFFALTFFHECGHILVAKCLRLTVKKVGIQVKPYPHFFVAVAYPRNNFERCLYLFSGTAITIIFFTFSLFFDFFNCLSLYFAFCLQIIIETNPFYSDITLAIITNKNSLKYGKSYEAEYKKIFSKHQFSKFWYLNFILWMVLILLLTKLYYVL